MQTIKDLKNTSKIDKAILPEGYNMNGWSNVLSHEMNVLFSALCEGVYLFDTKEEIKQHVTTIKALKNTFKTINKELFRTEDDYLGYTKLLEKNKKFLERSKLVYPDTQEQAIGLFEKWGLLIDKGNTWDIPFFPFPDVQNIFTLADNEIAALNYIKLESLIHPLFSRLVLTLHEKDENSFLLSKNELKEMLNVNDEILLEVLIKLTPYLKEPIDNIQAIPNDEKMEFTIVWERIYEDFLGEANPQTIQQ